MGKKVKVVVDGNSVEVSGETYSVRESLKKYGLKWDKWEKKWIGNTEDFTAEQLRNLAEEIGAELIVKDYKTYPEDIQEFLPDEAKKVIDELLKEEVEALKDDMDTAIAKILYLNSDNIAEDEDAEELREYLKEKGLSEEAIEKLIERLDEWGIELYTSPYFNFYKSYDVEPAEDPLEFLRNLVAAYENWADVEEDATWQGIESYDDAEWFYNYVRDFYEKEAEEGLFNVSYLDGRLNKHYHEIRWEQWGDYEFIIYEKTGVGYGRKVRVCNALCADEIEDLKETLKELEEKAGNTDDVKEVLDIIEKALDLARFEGGRITWAETW